MSQLQTYSFNMVTKREGNLNPLSVGQKHLNKFLQCRKWLFGQNSKVFSLKESRISFEGVCQVFN